MGFLSVPRTFLDFLKESAGKSGSPWEWQESSNLRHHCTSQGSLWQEARVRSPSQESFLRGRLRELVNMHMGVCLCIHMCLFFK